MFGVVGWVLVGACTFDKHPSRSSPGEGGNALLHWNTPTQSYVCEPPRSIIFRSILRMRLKHLSKSPLQCWRVCTDKRTQKIWNNSFPNIEEVGTDKNHKIMKQFLNIFDEAWPQLVLHVFGSVSLSLSLSSCGSCCWCVFPCGRQPDATNKSSKYQQAPEQAPTP